MNIDAPQSVSPALLLELFDEPIVFNRCHLRLTGSVTAALFLSYACQLAAELDQSLGGWLSLTREEWTQHIGLSRTEQETARKILREAGVIEERRIGMPARLEIKVNTLKLYTRIRAQAAAAYEAAVPSHHSMMIDNHA